MIHLSGIFGEGTVGLAHNLLAERCKFHGASALIASCDQPRSLLVNEAVINNVGDVALAEFTSGKKCTVPSLLRLREIALSIVIVSQPQV